jgi:hypothetical protein
MSDTFPLICHGASRKRGAFVRLRIQMNANAPGPASRPVSSYKMSNRLIPLTFHLPIINLTRRILVP